jgi:predicted nuclease of predicted toxin-antitoxin system
VSDRPTFYVDRCVGKRVVRALRDAGARVEAHDDHFAQDAADEAWIPDVTARGWVILTKDKNIRRRAGEREAVVTASARMITLASGNMSGETMAGIFVGNLAAMEQLAGSQPAPFVAVLGPGGMQVVLPKPAPPTPQGQTELPGDQEPPPDATSGS